jgi:hypothetical protein
MPAQGSTNWAAPSGPIEDRKLEFKNFNSAFYKNYNKKIYQIRHGMNGTSPCKVPAILFDYKMINIYTKIIHTIFIYGRNTTCKVSK